MALYTARCIVFSNRYAGVGGTNATAGHVMRDHTASTSGSGANSKAAGNHTYWPDQEWRTSTPEQQGIDSGQIARLLRYITRSGKNINSFLLIRNGYLATEAYFSPHRSDTRHDLASATKSIISMLIGIAIQQAAIPNVDQPVLSFFRDRRPARIDARKKQLTLAHALSMTTGLNWKESGAAYKNRHNTLSQMMRSWNWVQFILDRPMARRPGEIFTYNSGASHLLSAILQGQTGTAAADFAAAHLFEPLGITDFHWASDPQGVTLGGWGLQLTPRAMARLGYLYLQRGIWNGVTLIPESWVDISTQSHTSIIPRASLKYRIRRQTVPHTWSRASAVP